MKDAFKFYLMIRIFMIFSSQYPSGAGCKRLLSSWLGKQKRKRYNTSISEEFS